MRSFLQLDFIRCQTSRNSRYMGTISTSYVPTHPRIAGERGVSLAAAWKADTPVSDG